MSVLAIPWWYYAVAALLFAALLLITKKPALSLVPPYLFMLFTLTVLARTPEPEAQYQLALFWSYRRYFSCADPHLLRQMAANVLVFIPLGALLHRLVGWKAVLIGTACSALIEVLQLITRRGVFEFDDILHNALGLLIGCAAAALIRRARKGKSAP